MKAIKVSEFETNITTKIHGVIIQSKWKHRHSTFHFRFSVTSNFEEIISGMIIAVNTTHKIVLYLMFTPPMIAFLSCVARSVYNITGNLSIFSIFLTSLRGYQAFSVLICKDWGGGRQAHCLLSVHITFPHLSSWRWILQTAESHGSSVKPSLT